MRLPEHDRRAVLFGGVVAAASVLGTVAAHPDSAAADVPDAVPVEGLTTRRASSTPEAKTARFGTALAQQELAVNLADLYLAADGTTTLPGTGTRVPDHSAAMERALQVAGDAGTLATIVIPSGVFVMAPFRVERPIRLLGLGAMTARYGQSTDQGLVWGGAQLVRKSGSGDAPLVTIDAQGVGIEGVSFNGRGASSPGVHVVQGFGLQMTRCRIIDFADTGLLIDRANNAVFDIVHVNNCGRAGGSASVAINSVGDPSLGRTNTLDLRGLTIEQNRSAALDIGFDTAKTPDGQFPEYLRFTDLHVESSNYDGADDGFLPDVPTIRIGVVSSATFVDPMVYGGPAALVHQDAGNRSNHLSSGVTFVGGVLRGQIKSVRDTPTLVRLVNGDEFRLTGTRFTQYTGTPIDIAQGFGNGVYLDPSAGLEPAPGTAAELPLVADARPAGLATSRLRAFGTLEAHGPVEVRDRILGRGRPVTVTAAGAHVAELVVEPRCDELRGRIVFRTSGAPRAGAQVRITLQTASWSTSSSVVVTPSDASAAALLPFAGFYTGNNPPEILVSVTLPPAANSRYGFYYTVVG